MISAFIGALPIALVWIGITGKVTLDSLAVGYVVGILTLLVLRKLGITFAVSRSPMQPIGMVQYVVTLMWSAITSSFKVARLVLSPKIELHTGILALNTGDLSEGQLLSALSAHAINLTPGELVLDLEDGGVLYIHCIDVNASRPRIEAEQAQRLRILKRIIGDKS